MNRKCFHYTEGRKLFFSLLDFVHWFQMKATVLYTCNSPSLGKVPPFADRLYGMWCVNVVNERSKKYNRIQKGCVQFCVTACYMQRMRAGKCFILLNVGASCFKVLCLVYQLPTLRETLTRTGMRTTEHFVCMYMSPVM